MSATIAAALEKIGLLSKEDMPVLVHHPVAPAEKRILALIDEHPGITGYIVRRNELITVAKVTVNGVVRFWFGEVNPDKSIRITSNYGRGEIVLFEG